MSLVDGIYFLVSCLIIFFFFFLMSGELRVNFDVTVSCSN